ncbi:MAG: PEP-CTERM sorting domain-containing protein, partial [Aeoliella sp.]
DGGASPWETSVMDEPQWTLDVSLKLNDVSAAPGFATLWTESTANRAIFVVTPTGITDFGGNAIGGVVDNSDALHAYQIQFDSADATFTGGTYTVYRDGVLQGQAGRTDTVGAGRLIVGDCCSTINSTPANPVDEYEIGHVRFDAVIPTPDTLTLEINTTTGAVVLKNNTAVSVDFNGYFIDSAAGQLNSAGWASLEDNVPTYGNGTPDDGLGWESFDEQTANFLGEGILTDGAGSPDFSTLAAGASVSLGTAYDPSVAGSGNDGDLVFTLTDQNGGSISSSNFGTIEYVTGGNTLFDANVDMTVNNDDIPDFVTALLNLADWETLHPGLDPLLYLDGDLNGTVNNDDIPSFVDALLNPPFLTSSSSAVPEPSSLALVALAGLVGLSLQRRKGLQLVRHSHQAIAVVAAFALLMTSALAAEDDREYTLGDDVAEGAVAGNTVGLAVGAITFDSAGTGGAGDLQDLTVNNSPTYVSVSDRPGAGGSDLGADFNSASADSLSTGISMNAPSQMWDNGDFFDGPPGRPIFPHNYEGIFSHGIQLWAKPDQTALGTATQSLVSDTAQHGVGINDSGNWELLFNDGRFDSEVTVASTLDENGWAHAMELSGFGDTEGGGSAFGGALLINGVAVVTRGTSYDAEATPLVIGADDDGNDGFENHYDGILDDVRLFFWGDNSDELGQDNAIGGSNTDTAANNGLNADGQDWLGLDLGSTNDWIANELDEMGVTDAGDVDLSGGAANAADEAAFVTHWRKQNLVGGLQIGDWNSRQEGDLNYDGIVDLRDAFILHDSLTAAGAGGLNFGLLGGAAVPEPSSIAIAMLGLLALGGLRYRNA